MQRRARIKAVANLSATRRGTNKTTEIKQEKNIAENKNEEILLKSSNDNEYQLCEVKISGHNETEISETRGENSGSVGKYDDDVNKSDEFYSDNLSENLRENNDLLYLSDANDKTRTCKQIKVKQSNQDAFKEPKHTPHVENNEQSSQLIKFRRPKITPRLNTSRSGPNVAAIVSSKDEGCYENGANILESYCRDHIESPVIFSPPSTPHFSPAPHSSRSRSDTPRDISESPNITVNYNIHYPPTPQSPFMPIPHSRIRTESICSLKSTTTVANLQPRKKVRTEDQKILDNKRESRERLSNKKIEKSQLRMFDMIYYNPSTNPMKPREVPKEREPKKLDLTVELIEKSPDKETTTAHVPQLRLNANGEMVLDESSLVVENEEQRKNRILLANTNVVFHDEMSGSYGYYKRQQRTKEWPQDETIKFFRCLNTVGTDFSLMLNLFPNRSRRDLKLKFKKEEKNNPNLVDKALRNHSIFDIEELQRELEEEENTKRKEAENKSSEIKELVKRKILSKQEAKARAQQQIKSKIEKILDNGDTSHVDAERQDVKENFKNSIDVKVKPIRQIRKRHVKEKKNEEMMAKKMILDQCGSTDLSVQSPFMMNTNDLSIDNCLDIGVMQSFDSVVTKKDEREAEIIHEYIVNATKIEDTLLSTTGNFISNGMNQYADEPGCEINEIYDNATRKKEEVNISQNEVQNRCSIKQEFPSESAVHMSESNSNFESELTSDANNCHSEIQQLSDNEILNSLDLERLVIVGTHENGEALYEIHETDSITQKVSEEPLKLPRRLVDLIVNLMMQED